MKGVGVRGVRDGNMKDNMFQGCTAQISRRATPQPPHHGPHSSQPDSLKMRVFASRFAPIFFCGAPPRTPLGLRPRPHKVILHHLGLSVRSSVWLLCGYSALQRWYRVATVWLPCIYDEVTAKLQRSYSVVTAWLQRGYSVVTAWLQRGY